MSTVLSYKVVVRTQPVRFTFGAGVGDIVGLSSLLSAKADLVHVHAIDDVTGLQGTLDALQSGVDSKAALSHGHIVADVTGLQGTLDALQSGVDSKLDGTPVTIPFDVSYTVTGAEADGTLYWNSDEGALEYKVPAGASAVNKEIWDYYTNLSGGAMVDGDVVSVIGVSGNRTAVDLTDATDPVSSRACIGVVTAGAANNQRVRVTKIGTVNSLHTNAYAEGTRIYVNPTSPGKWTATQPTFPNASVCVGVVKVASANSGVVDVDIFPDLTTTIQTTTAEQALVYAIAL